jgi:hypothetical protein
MKIISEKEDMKLEEIVANEDIFKATELVFKNLR